MDYLAFTEEVVLFIDNADEGYEKNLFRELLDIVQEDKPGLENVLRKINELGEDESKWRNNERLLEMIMQVSQYDEHDKRIFDYSGIKPPTTLLPFSPVLQVSEKDAYLLTSSSNSPGKTKKKRSGSSEGPQKRGRSEVLFPSDGGTKQRRRRRGGRRTKKHRTRRKKSRRRSGGMESRDGSHMFPSGSSVYVKGKVPHPNNPNIMIYPFQRDHILEQQQKEQDELVGKVNLDTSIRSPLDTNTRSLKKQRIGGGRRNMRKKSKRRKSRRRHRRTKK